MQMSALDSTAVSYQQAAPVGQLHGSPSSLFCFIRISDCFAVFLDQPNFSGRQTTACHFRPHFHVFLQLPKDLPLQVLLHLMFNIHVSVILHIHISHFTRVSPGHGKSWNLGRPFSGPGKSWKIAKVMESHGKVMENSDNVMEFLLLH